MTTPSLAARLRELEARAQNGATFKDRLTANNELLNCLGNNLPAILDAMERGERYEKALILVKSKYDEIAKNAKTATCLDDYEDGAVDAWEVAGKVASAALAPRAGGE